ncbi:hypothetical protein ANO11243_033550 [Dothideomycetidae sp. 11243]|nr:hypothetical protein ANO11243_033550 [fungal sp. No.11243]
MVTRPTWPAPGDDESPYGQSGEYGYQSNQGPAQGYYAANNSYAPSPGYGDPPPPPPDRSGYAPYGGEEPARYGESSRYEQPQYGQPTQYEPPQYGQPSQYDERYPPQEGGYGEPPEQRGYEARPHDSNQQYPAGGQEPYQSYTSPNEPYRDQIYQAGSPQAYPAPNAEYSGGYNTYNAYSNSSSEPVYTPADSEANSLPPYEGGPAPPVEGERGFGGAVAGAALGAYGGHKLHHGFLGAIAGSVAGSKLQDAMKHHKENQQPHPVPSPSGGHSPIPAPIANNPSHHNNHEVFAGNFSASSTQITLDRDYDMIALCRAVDGTEKLSSVSLNACLTNEWGQLKWARGGNFGASSRDVHLVDGGMVLQATLGDGNGGWQTRRIRLDEKISNNDGELVFLG